MRARVLSFDYSRRPGGGSAGFHSIDATARARGVFASPKAAALLFAAAIAAAVAGVVVLVLMLAARPAGDATTAGGLSLSVDSAEWIGGHEMPDMPALMMAGMPAEGQQRLRVELTLRNPGDGPQDFRPEEFLLRSAGGDYRQPVGSSFAAASLVPGQAFNGALFFDLSEPNAGLRLVWTKTGDEFLLPDTSEGPAPGQHGHSEASP